mmetsp:Transcript_7733/g.17830  ORF Transcript_7733/g.17830 Transcript_7733/m.17830 type:complete len:111 (-) Transcript_7733:1238-1570(-)
MIHASCAAISDNNSRRQLQCAWGKFGTIARRSERPDRVLLYPRFWQKQRIMTNDYVRTGQKQDRAATIGRDDSISLGEGDVLENKSRAAAAGSVLVVVVVSITREAVDSH